MPLMRFAPTECGHHSNWQVAGDFFPLKIRLKTHPVSGVSCLSQKKKIYEFCFFSSRKLWERKPHKLVAQDEQSRTFFFFLRQCLFI